MPSGCSLDNPVACVASAAQSVAADAFGSIARDFGDAAQTVIGWLWSQLSSATAIRLGGAGFDADLAIVATISATVAVGLFVVQVISSALRRDPGGLVRAGKGLVIAFIAGGVAAAVTNAALVAVDALSAGVVQTAMGTDIAGAGPKLLDAAAIGQLSNPAVLMLVSMAAIAAAVIVWFALMVRKVLIVVSTVFAPLAFAGSLADITISWTRRWIETMAALVFSKLVLVVILVVGWGVLDAGAGMAGSSAGQGLTQLAAGLLILTVGGLAPWMALKLVHFSGEQFHHLHGLAGSATGGAASALAAPQKVAAWKATAAGLGAGPPVRTGLAGAGGTRSSANPSSGAPTAQATGLIVGSGSSEATGLIAGSGPSGAAPSVLVAPNRGPDSVSTTLAGTSPPAAGSGSPGGSAPRDELGDRAGSDPRRLPSAPGRPVRSTPPPQSE